MPSPIDVDDYWLPRFNISRNNFLWLLSFELQQCPNGYIEVAPDTGFCKYRGRYDDSDERSPMALNSTPALVFQVQHTRGNYSLTLRENEYSSRVKPNVIREVSNCLINGFILYCQGRESEFKPYTIPKIQNQNPSTRLNTTMKSPELLGGQSSTISPPPAPLQRSSNFTNAPINNAESSALEQIKQRIEGKKSWSVGVGGWGKLGKDTIEKKQVPKRIKLIYDIITDTNTNTNTNTNTKIKIKRSNTEKLALIKWLAEKALSEPGWGQQESTKAIYNEIMGLSTRSEESRPELNKGALQETKDRETPVTDPDPELEQLGPGG